MIGAKCLRSLLELPNGAVRLQDRHSAHDKSVSGGRYNCLVTVVSMQLS